MLCFYDNILSSVVVQAKDGDSSHDVPFSKQRELTSLSLCADTGPSERFESKHRKNDLKCHLFTSEKILPFFFLFPV